MKRLVPVLAGLALLGLVAWLLLGPRRSGAAGERPSVAADASSAARELAPLEPTGGALPSGRPDRREEVLAPASQEHAEPQPEDDPLAATIRGRFLFADGRPAAGVAVRVEGFAGNAERRLTYGVPADWTAPSGESGPDGRFALAFEPPRAFQFTLRASLPEHAPAAWRWPAILAGRTIDVGDVVLVRSGAVEGRIVDAHARPLPPEAWRVLATGARAPGDQREPTRAFAESDPETSRFRLADLPPGDVDLRAQSPLASWIDGPTVTVVAGETVEATILYDGPSLRERITVVTFSRPFAFMSSPAAASIRLHGAASGPRAAKKIAGSTQTYVFDELAPGAYTLEIDDPSYRPWRETDVRPGTAVTAHLEGSAALRLDVRDEAGTPVQRYALRVRLHSVSFQPGEVEVHDGREPLPGGLLEGMFPGDSTLVVSADDAGRAEVDVGALQPGETRAVSVVLVPTSVVLGLVTSGGAPAAGVDVRLLAPAEVDDSGASPVLRAGARTSAPERYRRELDATATDGDGAFELRLPGAGTYVLLAERGAGVQRASAPFTVAAGERERVDLELPGGGGLTGRVHGAPPDALRGLRLWARPDDLGEGPDAGLLVVSSFQEAAVLGGEGSYELTPLGPGEFTVFLFPPAAHQQGLRLNGFDWRPEGALELGRVTIPEGETVRRDFELGNELSAVRARVRNHGAPLAGAGLTLLAEDGATLTARTDANGEAGPIPVFAGRWEVLVEAPKGGWTYRHPVPLEVAGGAEPTVDVDVEVSWGTLTFVDAGTGAPLANRAIAQERFDPERLDGPFLENVRETDARGRLGLTLTPGEYRFVLDPPDPFESVRAGAEASVPREARVLWTADGPADGVVRL